MGIVFAAYLVFHQREDVGFALSSAAPVQLGSAVQALDEGRLAEHVNRYVRLEGVPDFESGLHVDTKGSWAFRHLFRLMGTDSRVLVQRLPDPLPLRLLERPSMAGRLVSLADVSFDASIRAYYQAHVSATHFFSAEAIAAGLARGLPVRLVDEVGSEVELAGNQRLTVPLAQPGRFRVRVPSGLRYLSPEAAQRALAATDAHLLSEATIVSSPGPGIPGGYVFDVEVASDQEAVVLSAIADLAPKVRIDPLLRWAEVPVRTLEVKEGRVVGLDAQSGAVVAFDEMGTGLARLISQLEVPQDAFLLIEGERPSHQYKALITSLLFSAFALFNIYGLARNRHTQT